MSEMSTIALILFTLAQMCSSQGILPGPVPDRNVQQLCASTTCIAGTTCRVVRRCTKDECLPYAACVPCVPKGVDQVCHDNRYLTAVLIGDSRISRFLKAQVCDPYVNNDQSGCPFGSVCARDSQATSGVCCYGKPELNQPLIADPFCFQPPKLCPPVPKSTPEFCATVRVVRSCELNSDCSKGKICCGSICGGTRCVNPKPILPPPNKWCPRVLPSTPEFCATAKVAKQCEDDNDCLKGQRCCKTICGGTKCINILTFPLPPKNVCPRVPPSTPEFCATAKVAKECEENNDCLKGQRCCKTICGGTKCINILPFPLPPKKVCPRVPPSTPELCANIRVIKECKKHSDCLKGRRCCGAICGGRKCVNFKPIPLPPKKVCPPVPLSTPEFCATAKVVKECDKNSDCLKGKLCCGIICGGKKCMNPVNN